MNDIAVLLRRAMGAARHYPWGLFALALAVAVAGHWLAIGLLHRLDPALPLRDIPLLRPTLSLLAASALAVMLYGLHHVDPRPVTWLAKLGRVVLAWGVFTAGLWLAVTLEEDLEAPLVHVGAPLYPALIVIGLLAVAAMGLLHDRLRDRFERVRDLLAEEQGASEQPEAHALVLFLSTPNIVPEVVDPAQRPQRGYHARIPFAPDAAATLGGSDLAADIAALTSAAPQGTFWNWQQVLRAIQPHRQLRQIWIIGSPDAQGYGVGRDAAGGRTDAPSRAAGAPQAASPTPGTPAPPGTRIPPRGGKGSFDYLETCRRLLQAYTRARIDTLSEPASFESFEELMGAVRGLLRDRLDAVPAEQVMIDVTGGMKVTSIVGATLTLHRAARFQYVSTQPPFRVITHRLVLESAPSAHGH
jgi:hypothetical protein